MSLESWKREFYPRPAADVKSVRAAINHSLRKWRGAFWFNLARHNLIRHGPAGVWEYGADCTGGDESRAFFFSSDSCALCHLFLNKTSSCEGCPLYEYRGVACEQGGRDEAYGAFVEGGPADLMVSDLEHTLLWYDERHKKRKKGQK